MGGGGGEYGGGGGKREIIYLFLHQNDFCIKMGSDESHFNVSVGSDGQSHKTTTFLKRMSRSGIEPRSLSLPLGQTGSQPIPTMRWPAFFLFLSLFLTPV